MSNFHIKTYGKLNKRIIFLLSGWKNKPWMYWFTAKILEKNGFYCFLYTYNDDIFSPDTKKTLKNLIDVSDDITKKIQNLKKLEYKDFSLFGTSLGTVICLMVANKLKDISKIILNTTGSDIAMTVWSWDCQNLPFKEELLKQKLTLKDLRNIWKPIMPLNNIENLKKKKILVYLSKKDEIIPYFLGEKLVQELRKRHYHVKVITNKYFGHMITAAINLLIPNMYLKFLND